MSQTYESLFRLYKEQNDETVFAHFPYPKLDFDLPFRKLAALATKESWDYDRTEFKKTYTKFPILRNYLNYTFLRLREQDRIAYSDDWEYACFNTGLQTPKGKDIFAVFKSSVTHSIKWTFSVFTDAASNLPLKSEKIPLPASYFEGHEAKNLVFDLSYKIDVDYDHILDENRERFPKEFQGRDTLLKNLLRGAIEELKGKILRNYKVAIPHWYKGELQLLLPLILSGDSADLALVAKRDDEKEIYKIVTVLTMDMAYVDARLICRPDKEWLNP